MKISIVTIVYNDKNNIEETLKCVLNQSARADIEYIVVDGYSTDGTSDIISEYRDKIDKHIREKDRGIYEAMNKGLRLATGDYILFLNSGDMLSSPSIIGDVIECINKADHHSARAFL